MHATSWIMDRLHRIEQLAVAMLHERYFKEPLRRELAMEIEEHLMIEEWVIDTLLARALDAAANGARKIEPTAAKVRAALRDLVACPVEDPAFRDRAAVLRARLAEHARATERFLVRELERRVPPEELESLSDAIARARASTPPLGVPVAGGAGVGVGVGVAG